jgi:ammonia channel protein AmtB
MKLSAILVYMFLWSILVYAPIAFSMWNVNGWGKLIRIFLLS